MGAIQRHGEGGSAEDRGDLGRADVSTHHRGRRAWPSRRIGREAVKRGRRLDEKVPGSGLGLSIVAELSHLYRGTLKLEKAPGGGLRACLTLPAV